MISPRHHLQHLNRNTFFHMPAVGCQGKVILCNGGILSSLDSASLLAESRPDSWLRVWKDLEADFRSGMRKVAIFSGMLKHMYQRCVFFLGGGTNVLLKTF